MKRILAAAIPLAACSHSSSTCAPYTSTGSSQLSGAPDMYPSCSTLCNGGVDGGPTLLTCESTPIDGGVAISCTFEGCHAVGGRRPDGFDAIALSAHDEIGAWLARAAALEAASVPAFRILAAELRAHGAPEFLIEEARRAADQETRHARAMMRLAHRYGGAAMSFAIAARPLRALEAIAAENAVEGCVREAFGAVVAREQARHAADAEVRVEFALIAPDEMGHARLATAVDNWACGQLSRAARRRVNEARDRARIQLVRALETETSPALRHLLGLPDATRAHDLVCALSDESGPGARTRRGGGSSADTNPGANVT